MNNTLLENDLYYTIYLFVLCNFFEGGKPSCFKNVTVYSGHNIFKHDHL